MDVVGRELMARVLKYLPKARLKLIHWSQGTVEGLEYGDIHMAINHFPIAISKSIRQIPITEDPGLLLARKSNPLIQNKFNFRSLSTIPLAGMVIPELTDFQSIVEDMLKEQGCEFLFRCDSLPLLFEAVENSDLIMTCLRIPASTCPDNLVGFLPENMPALPKLSVAVYYHHRNSNQAMTRWLFELCKSSIQSCDRAVEDKLTFLQ